MAEEVLSPLIGRVPARRVGTILGFSRGCVRGEAFPAVLRSGADDQVEGLLIEDLLPHELRALDYYVSGRHSNLQEPTCRPNIYLRRTRATSASESQSPPLTATACWRCATCGRRPRSVSKLACANLARPRRSSCHLVHALGVSQMAVSRRAFVFELGGPASRNRAAC